MDELTQAYRRAHIDGWLHVAYERLIDRQWHEHRVTSWGRGLTNDGLVVHVTLWPRTPEGEAWVRDDLAPIPIEVAEAEPLRFHSLYEPRG